MREAVQNTFAFAHVLWTALLLYLVNVRIKRNSHYGIPSDYVLRCCYDFTITFELRYGVFRSCGSDKGLLAPLTPSQAFIKA
jgi:hypothetical protein